MVRSNEPLKDLPGIVEIRRLYEAGKVSKREATRRVEAVVKDCGVCSWHAGPLDEYLLFGHSNKFPEIIGEVRINGERGWDMVPHSEDNFDPSCTCDDESCIEQREINELETLFGL